jgi:hypothetical protein
VSTRAAKTEEAEERDGQQRCRGKASPAEPAGKHPVSERRKRCADDKEDRRERTAHEDQETDLIDESARVGIEHEVVRHGDERGRPRHSVANEHEHRGRDPARPGESGEHRRLLFCARDQGPHSGGEDDERQPGGRDEVEGDD